MTRRMIDVTHSGLAPTMAVIKELPINSLVAVYDTGSGGIAVTQSDMDELLALPAHPVIVSIDQGFTGSPNPNAMVRDCEDGAWTLPNAVKKNGWNVPRPTLYLGYPDTAIMAYNAGWRGDVWLVAPSNTPPTKAPIVPNGLNVVGVQWKYAANYDESIIFDESWPKMVTPPPAPVKVNVPPGQWNNAKDWSWTEVVMIGTGTDGNLYSFAFNPATGEWIKQSLPGLQRD